MIDVWMLFTMMYPFSTVSLYAIIEVLSRKDENAVCDISKEKDQTENRISKIIEKINLYLNFLLPLFATLFILAFFWVGIYKSENYNNNIDC